MGQRAVFTGGQTGIPPLAPFIGQQKIHGYLMGRGQQRLNMFFGIKRTKFWVGMGAFALCGNAFH